MAPGRVAVPAVGRAGVVAVAAGVVLGGVLLVGVVAVAVGVVLGGVRPAGVVAVAGMVVGGGVLPVGRAGPVVVGAGVAAVGVVGPAAAALGAAGAVPPTAGGDGLGRTTAAVTRAAVPASVATSQPRPGRTIVSVAAPTTAAAVNAARTSGRTEPDGPGQRRTIADGGLGTGGAPGHGWG
ncbi:hypothetical protein [Micromonospora sp. NPDC049204]|uniref:hypothetical protein n=1 Tax=unclassified Micromonospora TaxID=2617518 RepID=UPI0033E89AB9